MSLSSDLRTLAYQIEAQEARASCIAFCAAALLEAIDRAGIQLPDDGEIVAPGAFISPLGARRQLEDALKRR